MTSGEGVVVVFGHRVLLLFLLLWSSTRIPHESIYCDFSVLTWLWDRHPS